MMGQYCKGPTLWWTVTVTCARALVGHVPNQSTTHRLNRAGEVAQRPSKPSLAGFIVNTTWSPRWTCIKIARDKKKQQRKFGEEKRVSHMESRRQKSAHIETRRKKSAHKSDPDGGSWSGGGGDR